MAAHCLVDQIVRFEPTLLVLDRCVRLFSRLAAHVFARSMRAGARSHSWSCAATAAQALPAAPAGMFKLAVHCALCAPWSSVCVRSLAVLFGVCAHLAHGAFVLCRCVGAACVLAGCVAVHLVRSRAFGSLRSLVPRGTASSVCSFGFALRLAVHAVCLVVGGVGTKSFVFVPTWTAVFVCFRVWRRACLVGRSVGRRVRVVGLSLLVFPAQPPQLSQLPPLKPLKPLPPVSNGSTHAVSLSRRAACTDGRSAGPIDSQQAASLSPGTQQRDSCALTC